MLPLGIRSWVGFPTVPQCVYFIECWRLTAAQLAAKRRGAERHRRTEQTDGTEPRVWTCSGSRLSAREPVLNEKQ